MEEYGTSGPGLLDWAGRFSPNQQRLILVLACGLLFFAWWFRVPLTELDEAVYSEVTREMVESGNYIVPYFNYTQYYEKPVLAYWMEAAAVHLFGLHETSLRLPSAVFSLLLVLMVHGFLLRRLGWNATPDMPGARRRARGAAFLGGAAVMIIPMIAVWSRAAILDAATSFFTTGAILAVFDADLLRRVSDDSQPARGRLRMRYMVGAVFAGLAFFAKGPVGLAIPAIVWGIYHLRERSLIDEIKRVPWIPVILLFAVTALPWYVAVTMKDGPAFLNLFFFKENFARYALTSREHHGFGPSLGGHLLGLLTYPSISLLLVFPISAFLFHELLVPLGGNGTLSQDAVLVRIRRFAWTWVFADMGFFALSSTQTANYIQAIAGGVGILFALHVLGRLSPQAERSRRGFRARWAEIILLSTLGLLFTLVPIYAMGFHRYQEAAFGRTALFEPAARIALILAVCAGILFQAGIWYWRIRRSDSGLIGWTVAVWIPVYLALLLAGMVYVRGVFLSTAEVGEFLQAQPRGERVLVYARRHPESLPYYAEREVECYREPSQERWFPFGRDVGRRHLPLDDEIRLAVSDKDPILIVTDEAGAREITANAPFDELRRFEAVEVLRLRVDQ